MSDLQEIVWTSAATLVSGAFLFVISQVIADLYLKPVIRFRELLSDLCFAVIYHSDYLCSSRFERQPEHVTSRLLTETHLHELRS